VNSVSDDPRELSFTVRPNQPAESIDVRRAAAMLKRLLRGYGLRCTDYWTGGRGAPGEPPLKRRRRRNEPTDDAPRLWS
jgi:hypothetical protein